MKKLQYGEYPPNYVKQLYDRHLNGENLSQIARSINRDPSTISKLFSKRKLKINKNINFDLLRKYERDDNYFNKIDTHQKAYILGFLYADGYLINKSENQYTLGIGLKIEDRHILEFIKKEIRFSGVIHESKTNYKDYRSCKLEIHSKQIGLDLIKLGLNPNKTFEEFSLPNINNKYINSFIYGYFDGDGSIYKFKNNLGSEYIGISICSPTINVLNQFKEILAINNIYSRVSVDKRSLRTPKFNDIYTITISRQKEVYKFIQFITKDFSSGLNRKLEKINNANTVLNAKFKDLTSV